MTEPMELGGLRCAFTDHQGCVVREKELLLGRRIHAEDLIVDIAHPEPVGHHVGNALGKLHHVHGDDTDIGPGSFSATFCPNGRIIHRR